MTDYDNPKVEAQWFAERRLEISHYLEEENIPYGHISNTPEWYCAPYVSIWAVESNKNPGSISWWVISGDLPNDYVSYDKAKNPKEAMHAIALLWQEAAQYMARGERHPTFIIGTGENDEELAPLLASRAEILLEWVNDPEAWET